MNLVEQKTNQAISILKELDIDAWITYVRKTSEIHDPSLYFLMEDSWLTWQTIIIITKTGRKIVICGRYDVPNLEIMGVYDTIIGYDQSIKDDLLKILDEIDPSSIAINYSVDNVAADGLTHGMWLRLNKFLEGTTYLDKLISSEKLLAALRGRKTELEVDRIRKAVDISESGHKKVTEFLSLGISEEDIEKMLLNFTKQNNVMVSYPPLIHVGPTTSIGHGKASADIKVKRGDLVNVDYGVFYEGYASDLQRMNYILREGEEEAPKEVVKAFDTVVRAITESAKKLKPGVQGWEVDKIAREIVKEEGYEEFMHALGHQVGKNVHDGGCLLGPRWEKYGESPSLLVEENQAFTLELHVYVENHGYMSIEEDVLVTKDGCEFLSIRQLELPLTKL